METDLLNLGTGQICTKPLLHKGSNMQKETLLQKVFFHINTFAWRVTFAQGVTFAGPLNNFETRLTIKQRSFVFLNIIKNKFNGSPISK